MRAATILVAVLLGCGTRTALELPDPSSSSPTSCPTASSWVVSAPLVIAPGTPRDASRELFDFAVHGNVTAIAHDVEVGPYVHPLDAVRFLTGDVLGTRQPLGGGAATSVSMIWTGDRFRASWVSLDAHLFTRDFDSTSVALTDVVDHGRLDERGLGSASIHLIGVWPDALLAWVGFDLPRYFALAPDGSPVGPSVALAPERRTPFGLDKALRRERLFVLMNDEHPPEESVLSLVTFNESTRSTESIRELARGLRLQGTSIVGGPDGALIVTAVEYGRRANLFTVRGDGIERSTLPVGGEYGAWLVENPSGTAALMSYSGSTSEPPSWSALHFSPMRLADRSIGDAVPIVVNSKGISDARVVADGCGFAVLWREESRVPGETLTTSFARIRPR